MAYKTGTKVQFKHQESGEQCGTWTVLSYAIATDQYHIERESDGFDRSVKGDLITDKFNIPKTAVDEVTVTLINDRHFEEHEMDIKDEVFRLATLIEKRIKDVGGSVDRLAVTLSVVSDEDDNEFIVRIATESDDPFIGHHSVVAGSIMKAVDEIEHRVKFDVDNNAASPSQRTLRKEIER